jgi:hypothetical protein
MSTDFDPELEAFKSRIDLQRYAASLGYEKDKRESSRLSTIMRNGGDKIIIKLNGDGHYLFFSVRDDRDNGTIIDFLQRRRRMNLGEVRKTLRPWIGRPPVEVPVFPALKRSSKDRGLVEVEYVRARDASRHPYLENERHLPPALLGSSRFAGRIRIDKRGMPSFRISILRGCAALRRKTSAIRASPRAAKRVCGSPRSGATCAW